MGKLKKLTFEVEGIAPLAMHNVRMANPREEIVQEVKKLTSKRTNKTQDDLDEIARLEWLGSLYVDENRRPCIPGENVEAMLREAARSQRLGKKFAAGVFCHGNFPLVYDGPDDPDELFRTPAFVRDRMMTVQRSKVLRTFPIFPSWRAQFEVMCNTSVVDVDKVAEMCAYAGELIGLCEFRPKFGRFVMA